MATCSEIVTGIGGYMIRLWNGPAQGEPDREEWIATGTAEVQASAPGCIALGSDAVADGYRTVLVQANGDPGAPIPPSDAEPDVNPKLVAERLMQKVLPEDVYLSLSALGYADVEGTIGRKYRLFRNRKTEITDKNGTVVSACIYLPGQALGAAPPDTDRIVAEYILITNDEKEYLSTANLTMISSPNVRPGPPVDMDMQFCNYAVLTYTCAITAQAPAMLYTRPELRDARLAALANIRPPGDWAR